jgi:presqualene diphosphate synthase
MALAQAAWTDKKPSKEDLDAIRTIVLAAGSSFYWAMRFQTQEKRDALFAVYAFCREVDDIADGDLSDDDKKAELQKWRNRIEALYGGSVDDPITRVLGHAVDGYSLNKDDFLAVIDGMEMDGVGPIRGPSLEELILYCDRVACAVGRLCVPIFGEPGEAGQATADHLGLALQLTNVLRDISEDAEIGRLYLPHDLLTEAGITNTDPDIVIAEPSLPTVCRILAQRAQDEYAAAESAIAQCTKASMRPAVIMMKVYRKTLERLIADDWQSVQTGLHATGLSRLLQKAEKLWIAVRYGLL